MKRFVFLFFLSRAAAAAESDQLVRRHHALRSGGNHPYERSAVAAHPRFVDAAEQRRAPLPDGYHRANQQRSGNERSAAATAPAEGNRHSQCNGHSFAAIYWGVVALLFASWFGLAYYSRHADDSSVAAPIMGVVRIMTSSQEVRFGSKNDTRKDELASSMWSLNLVAAMGKARYPNGAPIHTMLVLTVSLLMAMLQVFALFLVVDSVDPHAPPITTVPATPWKTPQHAWTVNSMKWVMVTFLGMTVVAEAGDAHKVFANAFMIDESRLRSWRGIPLMTSVLHYVINIGVVIAGVSVVLCCQDVPSILYNSLAITFINKFDDTTLEFFDKVCGIDVDLEIAHEKWDAPAWLEIVERFVLLLPFLWAFFLIGRSWCTNQLPSELIAWLVVLVHGQDASSPPS